MFDFDQSRKQEQHFGIFLWKLGKREKRNLCREETVWCHQSAVVAMLQLFQSTNEKENVTLSYLTVSFYGMI